MKYLDLTMPTPQENIACDERLLDAAERGEGGEVLRFWESADYFVVAGYGNKIETEVNTVECRRKNIPVLRRCSGGGTVAQGPGCLNYALVLEIAARPELCNISRANRFIMERNREAIASKLPSPKSKVEVCGHTDLAMVTRHVPPVTFLKFSGNAQRRRRRFLLFHGTFLLSFDLALISDLLPMPSRQPGYRQARCHDQFLMNLEMSGETVKSAMMQAWNADSYPAQHP